MAESRKSKSKDQKINDWWDKFDEENLKE